MLKSRYCALLILANLLIGCVGHRVSAPQYSDERFLTAIANDGTKFFVYSLALPKQPLPSPYAVDNQRNQSRNDDGQRKNRHSLSKQRLERIMQRTQYCRENFLELERRDLSDKIVVRGECREAATAEDRKRFNNAFEPDITSLTALRKSSNKYQDSL